LRDRFCSDGLIWSAVENGIASALPPDVAWGRARHALSPSPPTGRMGVTASRAVSC